jgi:hypothetical protein
MTIYIEDNPLHSVQMMPDEIGYMEQEIRNLPSNGLMVEWGSGGSTLQWLSIMKDTQTLISIEHNTEWYNRVAAAAVDYKNFKYCNVDVSSQYFEHIYGSVTEETPFNTKLYVCPTVEIYDSDIFFIDGIARGACLAAVLLNRKKKNSKIFVHDYTYRVIAYDWITQFCQVKLIGTTLAEITYY